MVMVMMVMVMVMELHKGTITLNFLRLEFDVYLRGNCFILATELEIIIGDP